MLKGCQKQMIVLHGTGSEIFEEAYFILKKNVKVPVSALSFADTSCGHSDQELLLEANRILEANRVGKNISGRRNYAFRCAVFFAVGIIVGALLIIATLSFS